MKVIVAGGREFNNYEFVKKNLLTLFENLDLAEIEIVSGGAPGVDSLGERFADEFGCKKKVIEADWTKFGNPAGPIRNKEMAEYAKKEHCVCFWDGKSPGTKSMIDLAKKNSIETIVIRYA